LSTSSRPPVSLPSGPSLLGFGQILPMPPVSTGDGPASASNLVGEGHPRPQALAAPVNVASGVGDGASVQLDQGVSSPRQKRPGGISPAISASQQSARKGLGDQRPADPEGLVPPVPYFPSTSPPTLPTHNPSGSEADSHAAGVQVDHPRGMKYNHGDSLPDTPREPQAAEPGGGPVSTPLSPVVPVLPARSSTRFTGVGNALEARVPFGGTDPIGSSWPFGLGVARRGDGGPQLGAASSVTTGFQTRHDEGGGKLASQEEEELPGSSLQDAVRHLQGTAIYSDPEHITGVDFDRSTLRQLEAVRF
jgi:hypothetical protein